MPRKGSAKPSKAKSAKTRKAAPPKHDKVGRPTAYKKEFCRLAKAMSELGATDAQMADAFSVSINTLGNWKVRYPEFLGAIKSGKEPADDRVERSLYQRAVGYEYDTIKIMQYEGSPVIVPYREHVPPDTTAGIFWLKNRRKEDWRDRQTIDTEKPIEVVEVGDQRERAKALAQLLSPLLAAAKNRKG